MSSACDSVEGIRRIYFLSGGRWHCGAYSCHTLLEKTVLSLNTVFANILTESGIITKQRAMAVYFLLARKLSFSKNFH